MAPALHGSRDFDAYPHLPDGEGRVREMPLSFLARDGYPLGGTEYANPVGLGSGIVVVFNAGAGFPVARYRNFLLHIASAGIPVLAYDYRGGGLSAPPNRRGFDAGFEEWAEYDQAAAIDLAAARYPNARLASISHSIGSMVAALSPNASQLEQMVFIAPHIGYWRDYRQPWRWPMAMMWHVVMPAITRVVGYFPSNWFGLGDALPRRFALQWAHQTRDGKLDPTLMSVEVRNRLLENAHRLALPALLLTFTDDAFVGMSACSRFVHLLPNLRTIRHHIERLDNRLPIDHWGFFRRRNAHLWSLVANFLVTPLWGEKTTTPAPIVRA